MVCVYDVPLFRHRENTFILAIATLAFVSISCEHNKSSFFGSLALQGSADRTEKEEEKIECVRVMLQLLIMYSILFVIALFTDNRQPVYTTYTHNRELT